MAKQAYLAVDLGASSGRVVAGLFDGQKLQLDEVARFENGPVSMDRGLYWNLPGLWTNIQAGLRAAKTKHGDAVKSLGVDAWGVDHALLGPNDELLGNPYCYRDRRTDGMTEQVFSVVPQSEVFAQTGIQIMPINSLYQFYAMRQQNPRVLDLAERMLMIPDVIHWLLSGVKANELTDATTSQCYNPQTRNWAVPLLEKLGIPTKIFGDLVAPGTTLGKLRSSVIDETGLTEAQVVVPAAHDTASAVLAVPTTVQVGQAPSWCYISSGTWSLMGVETPTPVLTPECQQANFTNEGGVLGTTRLLKNITGLWIIQECRRVWANAGREYSWSDLTRAAAEAPSLVSFIDPDHADFSAPGDMPAAIRAYCQRTGQTVPSTEGAVIRTAIESLALKYRKTLELLESLTGTPIQTIHIVGGGVQNETLCQAAADACNKPVVAGPVETTAAGNCLMQAIAVGAIGSIDEARAVVRASFPVKTYEPRNRDAWQQAYGTFLGLLAKG